MTGHPETLDSTEEQAGDSNDFAGQAKRFAIVGLIATSLHFLVIVLAIHLFALPSTTLATMLGTCVGILTSYLGHHRYTFAAEGRHRRRFSMFIAAYGVVMALHAGLMYLLSDRLGLTYAIPFLIATAISALVTFVLNREVVFRPIA